jgi:pyruvate/2-oxoglutarate dehydrogenase complex dihydrolipoamide acyltransferase (E2) component
VVVEGDAIAIRSMMYLCLSFDHRLNDGLEAARFLQAVRRRLEAYGGEINIH